jgi:hypothetical protein
MKKNLIVLASVIICSIIAAYFYLQPSKAELEQKRISEIVTKGDSVIITEYLKGNTALTQHAIKSASSTVGEYMTRSSFSIVTLNGHLNMEMVKKAFSVLETALGDDSLAGRIYHDNKFDEYYFANMESGEWWNKRTTHLTGLLSENVNHKLRKLVLEKEEDPFWVHKYVSHEEMMRLILSNHFGTEHTSHFIPRSCDPALIADIAKSVSDSLITVYKIGNAISKERRYKIANNLPLDDAYNFFLQSGVKEKEISQLISSRISETEGYDLLFYFATKFLTKSEVAASLQNKTTSKLIGDFPSRTTVNIWEFPYETFSKYVINSVKNMDDYKLAVEFFKQTAPSEDEDTWIEVLRKKANI